MEDLDILFAQLEQVQNKESSGFCRLSERSALLLLLKLQELGRFQLIHTEDGKEFVTPSRLQEELVQELRCRNGRMKMIDLQRQLGVYIVILIPFF
jgi:hypothetical protein